MSLLAVLLVSLLLCAREAQSFLLGRSGGAGRFVCWRGAGQQVLGASLAGDMRMLGRSPGRIVCSRHARFGSEADRQVEQGEKERTRIAMENARMNSAQLTSPGAGLSTAEEQAEAAFADMINTTMDQRGIESLTETELENLSRGSQMWEKGSTTRKRKFGLLGDVMNLFGALASNISP